jgi:hypothetical protein
MARNIFIECSGNALFSRNGRGDDAPLLGDGQNQQRVTTCMQRGMILCDSRFGPKDNIILFLPHAQTIYRHSYALMSSH